MDYGNTAEAKIKRVYYDYLRVKPYNKITVSEIIKAAGVNRSSFYRHFTDVFSLYKRVCDELINVILMGMPSVETDSDMRAVAEAALARALQFLDEIRLLAGKNGSRRFLYQLRNAYFDALKTNAVKNGLWDDGHSYMTSFAADYLTFTLTYFTSEEQLSVKNFSSVSYTYDFAADPIDNISEALRVLNGGSRDTHAAFLVSLIRRFSTGDSRARSVTELLSFSGFSRAEFYKLYSHKSNYFTKLENALFLIIVKGVIPLLEIDDPMQMTLVLDNWDRYYKEIERNAVINGMNDGYLLDLGIKSILHLYEAYKKSVEKRLGKKASEEYAEALRFFVCSASCCFVYYIATMDREQYFQRMKKLFEIKKELGI